MGGNLSCEAAASESGMKINDFEWAEYGTFKENIYLPSFLSLETTCETRGLDLASSF